MISPDVSGFERQPDIERRASGYRDRNVG